MGAPDPALVFDVGLHRGEDAAFYLSKGFSVVGVEASPQLAAEAAEHLGSFIEAGRLTVVNAAVAERDGPVTFYLSENSVWGTTDPSWLERNQRLGWSSAGATEVEGVTCARLFAEHGIPYYMKIDIEGADRLCLEALRGVEEPCPYLSIEAEKVSWSSLVAELDLLSELGYTRFKVVPQHKVHRQVPPEPALEGQYVPHRFSGGESGLFGEEAPGRWLTRSQAIRRYRLIFLRYAIIGDDGLLSRGPLRRLRDALFGIGIGPGWYDTHAGR